MNPVFKQRFKLALLLALFFFFIMMTTSFIITSLVFILVHCDILHPGRPNFWANMLATLISCTLLGTLLTTLFGQRFLRSSQELAMGIKELARGNFAVRIHLSGHKILEELSFQFNQMAKELGSIEILRNDFINNFSHEFKTPISSISGFAHLLKKDHLTPEERHEYIDIIISESDRLAALSTNILNLSKIENQATLFHTQLSRIDEQLRQTILLLEPKWSKKQLLIIPELEDISLSCDAELLMQVWINLLDNAIKFSPPNQSITVKVSTLKRSKWVHVCITDHGKGMTERTKKHLFDKFYQEDASHTYEGNGLGLALVKRIVELHQGYIQVVSAPNQGSAFTVCLPMK